MADCRIGAHDRGFTLIEVMIVVAVIGLLALIAVPVLTGESRRGKASSEVTAFFSALTTGQEQYKLDRGVYLDTVPCPAAPSGQGQPADCNLDGNAWCPNAAVGDCLRMAMPLSQAYCSYDTVVGTTTGTNNPGGFSFTSPNAPWYYIIATCDMDDDGAVSNYFISSVDSTIQSQNEGE